MKTPLLTNDLLILLISIIAFLSALLIYQWLTFRTRRKTQEEELEYRTNLLNIHKTCHEEHVSFLQKQNRKLLKERNELKGRVTDLEAGKWGGSGKKDNPKVITFPKLVP